MTFRLERAEIKVCLVLEWNTVYQPQWNTDLHILAGWELLHPFCQLAALPKNLRWWLSWWPPTMGGNPCVPFLKGGLVRQLPHVSQGGLGQGGHRWNPEPSKTPSFHSWHPREATNLIPQRTQRKEDKWKLVSWSRVGFSIPPGADAPFLPPGFLEKLLLLPTLLSWPTSVQHSYLLLWEYLPDSQAYTPLHSAQLSVLTILPCYHPIGSYQTAKFLEDRSHVPVH